MKDAWSERAFAQAWDREGARRDNPDRGEQLDLLVTLLADACRGGGWILDLGSGSGQIEEMILERIPAARVVGVDNSSSMMALARERLARFAGRFVGVEGDMAALGGLGLPHAPYAFVISVQAVHEIPHPAKREVFARAFGLLEPGGAFFLLDRVAPDFEGLPRSYRSVWERLNRKAGIEEPMTFKEYVEKYGAKGDHVAGLEDLLGWLRGAGFRAAPLYLHYNRALIAAQRPAAG